MKIESVNCGYAENWVFRSQNTGQKSSCLETNGWEKGLGGGWQGGPPFFVDLLIYRNTSRQTVFDFLDLRLHLAILANYWLIGWLWIPITIGPTMLIFSSTLIHRSGMQQIPWQWSTYSKGVTNWNLASTLCWFSDCCLVSEYMAACLWCDIQLTIGFNSVCRAANWLDIKYEQGG